MIREPEEEKEEEVKGLLRGMITYLLCAAPPQYVPIIRVGADKIYELKLFERK